jgi:hypothetical protein
MTPSDTLSPASAGDADLDVLAAVAQAQGRLRHVRIDAERLALVCGRVTADEIRLPTWDFPVFYRAAADALAGQIVLFNAINFCYWGDPRWEVEFAGRWWDGSMAVLAAIHRAIDEGLPILDGAWLAGLDEGGLAHILRGRGGLHLLAERLAIWREVGAGLQRDYDSRFTHLLAAAEGDALRLVRLLTSRFPSFNDVQTFEGAAIPFHKRAQLAAAMLFEAFGGQGWGRLAGVDRLTVFADYKLPQVLRRLGILRYDAELAATVDSATRIPAGDRREVEIRIATIWTAELMRRGLRPRLPAVTALHLDYWLWFAGRQQGPEVKPYHRTLTTAY